MIELRPFASLRAANHGWLDAHHHFSFADYHDPARTHWGRLRVWNDDVIAAGAGFPPHPHRDMEIITYVRTGAISHRDSLGNEGRTAAGDVQVMSAGTGIEHSEFNQEDEPCTLFQIWIMPDSKGMMPNWGTRPFPKQDRSGRWVVLACGNGESDDALPINANASVLGASLKAGESLTYDTMPDRHLYLVAATGRMSISEGGVDAVQAEARDGIAISKAGTITISALADSEIVLVDAV